MDYDALVAKVIALLQREKRVPYRVLKRRFDLDDDYIEDLKSDLIEAKRLAIDENDRILVWIGDAQEVTTPSAQAIQPPAAQEQHSPQVDPVPTVPPPEAERRQLTVMFCDLVDSTKLSSQLDPEEYRDVVRAYQQVCSEVITRFDGHIAQLLGDGLLVYFGYPHAHEDDAQRAVRTGFGIIEAIGTLNTRLEQDKGIRLAVRLGIHTGLVVVGAMGAEGRQEQLALGEVPNLAARLQGLAEPNTVALSAATHRLVQGYFECQELGEQALRGVAEPIAVYRVLQESGVQSRLDVASTRGLTPLVGREQEVGLLLERWNHVKEGQGQVVLLTGEGGIGKSRLVQVLKEHVANEPHVRWECRSSPYYQNSALYPLTDFFQRVLQSQPDDSPEQRLTKLEQQLKQYRIPLSETMPLFASLLSLPLPEDTYPPLHLSPQRQRQKTLESLIAIVLELAEREPVLFILEDLHWTDPTTLEFLSLLVEQVPTAALYTLLTCRPHFQPAWHHRSYLTEITVNRLSRNQIEQVATYAAGGKTFPAEIMQQLVDKTDGVPLYCEEMTKAILESGYLKEIDGRYELTGTLPTLAIPATLHDSLMARLDRLVTAKAVAQYAAVIGRQFSYELLQAVSELEQATLQRELSRLVEAELLYQRGLPPQATYIFKHALIQDTAYESLLRSTKQAYHRRIADVLAAWFPETAENQPDLLAYHCVEAGLNEQAVGYWQQAGEKAVQRAANAEAVAHLNKGLQVLKTLPDTPQRAQRELALHMILGQSLINMKGTAAPEVEQTFHRAHVLCQQIGTTSNIFRVLNALRSFYLNRAELETARELNAHMLRIAQDLQEPLSLLNAHAVFGHTLVHLGEFTTAQTHLEQGLTVYASQHPRSLPPLSTSGQNLETFCLSWLANALWLLGYPEQAVQRDNEALALAQAREHLFNLVNTLNYSIWLHRWRGQRHIVEERLEASMALSTAYGFAMQAAIGKIAWGFVLTERGDSAGLALMHEGLTAYRATGSVVRQPWHLAELAAAHGKVGQAEEGLTALIEALALVKDTNERWYEAELHRLKGELLLQQSSDNATEAETCFQQAIAIAQNQSAKSWELRAATSLARLWQQQGKRDEARQLLGDVYGWFTEGFDTADLKDAKALLGALRA